MEARPNKFCRKNRAQTPETRAKISATMKAKGVKPVMNPHPPTRPKKGTPEYRLFRKIAERCGLGAAAAHAELRRGGP
jgi:hypothetical protein